MKQKYIILIFILILAFFACGFGFSQYLNQGIDILNQRFSLHLPHFWEKPFYLGLDLQGGAHLVYEADLSDIPKEDREEVMGGLRDVIERRINIFGVREPRVQIQGKKRLIVELAGVKDISRAIEMIGETPYLEFLEERPEEEIDKILKKREEIKGKSEEEYKEIENWELALKDPYHQPTKLTGKYLRGAEVGFDQTTYKPRIELEFNKEGSELFTEITKRNKGKSLAIFLDGMSIVDTDGDGKITQNDRYAPIVQEEITGGKAVITGDMDVKRAKEIVSRLNSGALPVKIGEPISQKTVGPTLGQTSLRKSLRAGIIGFLAVILFMIIYYRLPGLLASLSLVIYIALILSLFKLVPVTLTLAGIGGFILSIGMAVDANVLIFSRLREELKERSFSHSVTEGFRRAWPSIRDGNLTTLIVALILFFFGTSFIKGFALVLGIGILVSMFSAIIITRTFLKIFEGSVFENWDFLWK